MQDRRNRFSHAGSDEPDHARAPTPGPGRSWPRSARWRSLVAGVVFASLAGRRPSHESRDRRARRGRSTRPGFPTTRARPRSAPARRPTTPTATSRPPPPRPAPDRRPDGPARHHRRRRVRSDVHVDSLAAGTCQRGPPPRRPVPGLVPRRPGRSGRVGLHRHPPGGAEPGTTAPGRQRLHRHVRLGLWAQREQPPQLRQLHRRARRDQRRPPHARLRRQPVRRRQLDRPEPGRGRHHLPPRRPVGLLLAGAAPARHAGRGRQNADGGGNDGNIGKILEPSAVQPGVPRQRDSKVRRHAAVPPDHHRRRQGHHQRSGQRPGPVDLHRVRATGSTTQVPAVPAGQPGPAHPRLPELLGRHQHRQRQPPHPHRRSRTRAPAPARTAPRPSRSCG